VALNDTPGATPEPSAHVLAHELAARITAERDATPFARILMLGIGSGRNLAPLLAAGLCIDVVEDDPERARAAATRFASEPRVRVARARYAGPYPFEGRHAAALSTHALLHGDARAVAAALAAVRNRLGAGAPLYATLGSTRDPRFGAGRRIDDATFAPSNGAEAGVAHVYFDERGLRALLCDFEVESLAEVAAAEHVGRWAHDSGDAAHIVHWFVRATARATRRDAP